MNWYGTSDTGSQSPAGPRAEDQDSMCGNAIMYDAPAGKILTLGGAPNYVSKYNIGVFITYSVTAPTLDCTVIREKLPL